MTFSLLLAVCLGAADPGAAGRIPSAEEHGAAMARANRSVVTLIARSSAADLLERLARQLGPQVRMHLAEAARQASQERVATGIVLGADGLIVTSASFATLGGSVRVRPPHGPERAAELIGADLATDVALFRTSAGDLVAAELAGSESAASNGRLLCVIGSLSENRCAHVEGRLSRAELNRGAGRLHDYLVLDVSVRPGSAGAAVVDGSGRVVGMVSAVREGGGTLAVPIATVREVAETLQRDGSIRRGWLGLNVVSHPDQHGPSNGIRVAGVVPRSPAARAGLRAGDIVVSFAGSPVCAIADFVTQVTRSKPGDRAEIRYLRRSPAARAAGGGEETVTEGTTMVELTERPAPDRLGAMKVRIATDERGWLGVNTQALTPTLSAQFGVPAESGVLVSEVVGESPAEQAGIVPGDVILTVAAQPVRSIEAFTAAVRARAPGQAIALEVIHAGRPRTITATLGQRPGETWLGQFQQFHLGFRPEHWRAITAAIEALPEPQRERTLEDVRALLDQASDASGKGDQFEELRREMERLTQTPTRRNSAPAR